MTRSTRIARPLCTLAALLVSIAGASAAEDEAAYDVLFRGARVIDGSGAAPRTADVAIRDGRIAAIGNLSDADAEESFDVEGKILCPGFVDLHSHADRAILQRREAENYVRQGVTTLVVGNCGGSPIDGPRFFGELHEGGAGVNIVLLIGHGSVRVAEVGDRNVPPTERQLAGMQRRVRELMEAGAVGLSTGLRYRPGAYAETDEVVAVTREIAPYGGFYATHMRDEGPHILEALDEALLIGREAGVPVHISHHKISSSSVWGLTRLTLARIDQARGEGRDVTLDHYPYGAGSSGISLMVPQPLIAGGTAAFRKRIDDEKTRAGALTAVKQLMRRKLLENGQSAENEAHVRAALARIQVARLAAEERLEGKNLTQILDDRGDPITLANGAELILELVGKGAGAIYHTIEDRPGGDVDRVMLYPQTCIASDGVLPVFNQGNPHPRSYGTYPRVLSDYVRERKLLSLQQAIHKMSGLPAQRLGWTDRGLIRPGYRADLVVFDPQRIDDKATFTRPHQYAIGVEHVLIGGEFVLESRKMTGRLPGRPVYSMPVADAPKQKLRRAVIDRLSRFDGRFALLAVDDDGRELVSFNADDPLVASTGSADDTVALRDLDIRTIAQKSTAQVSVRKHGREEAPRRRIDLFAVVHVQTTDMKPIHLAAVINGMAEAKQPSAVMTIEQQLSRAIFDYFQAAQSHGPDSPPKE